jgi:hypothetical protein
MIVIETATLAIGRALRAGSQVVILPMLCFGPTMWGGLGIRTGGLNGGSNPPPCYSFRNLH